MKTPLALLSLFFVHSLGAHQHVDVWVDPHSPESLALHLEADLQYALYVPRGVPLSYDVPFFPGGWHASELTFTTTTELVEEDPQIEIVSVSGPPGGIFSFWEVGAREPTWARQVGWSSAQGAVPSFKVVVGGDNHIHGRCFTMDRPGDYTVTFRAVATVGNLLSSPAKTITFRAQQPPQLSIRTSASNVLLSFSSRNGFTYDLQACTDIAGGLWTNVPVYEFMPGTGASTNLILTNGLVGRPSAFYRLVEY
jgi:hypothetical protein